MKYRTRGMIHPQGKPKVYFCCHPRDFEPCFERITDAILQCSNCAVWYDNPSNPVSAEDLRADLGQMQLFVMPVTGKLLTEPNNAMDIEFPFAIAHHIPVLPLLEEDGIVSLYNQKCGDLHFLDKLSNDQTTIGFDEKLRNYLSAVLIGDEMAAKIRAAFDAYIFLSYRKKDRRFAQELMRLIHRNPFCRDIAIWYDEFLTPGENFNESIAHAMQKSSLFAMAVTPNLVNETNYVVEMEYPEAKSAKLPIIGFEMAPTDREALDKRFGQLSRYVEARNPLLMETVLLDTIGKIAKKENKASAEHNFFIGLAYLDGIDVEVDNGLALSLIEGSAEAGLAEAMKKLVTMYRTGKGVKRSFHDAVAWQRRLVALYQKDFSDGDCFDYVAQLDKLSMYLLDDLMDLSSAEETTQELVRACTRWRENYGSRNGTQFLAGGYVRLSRIHKERGDLPQARINLEKAEGLYEYLADHYDREEDWRNRSMIYCDLGMLDMERNAYADARLRFQDALTIAEHLVTVEGCEAARSDMFHYCLKLGDVYCKEGDFESARQSFEKCSAMAAQFEKENNDLMSISNAALCYDRLAEVYNAQGAYPDAMRLLKKALEKRVQYSQETETPVALRYQAYTYVMIARTAISMEDFFEARTNYEEALRIVNRLYASSPTQQQALDLCTCLEDIGALCEKEKNMEAARKYYEEVLEIAESLAAESQSDSVIRAVGMCYERLGFIAKKEGAQDAARRYYEKMYAIVEKAEAQNPSDLNMYFLALSSYRLGTVGYAERRREHLERAYKIWSGLSAKHPQNRVYKSYADQAKKLL